MKNTRNKPRVALLAMGILGENKRGQGIPVLTDLFRRLARHFDIVFYSYGPLDAKAVPASIPVRKILSAPLPGRLKYLFLSIRLLVDHWIRPYDVLFAVSVFPTGMWAVRVGKLIRRKVVVQAIALEFVSLPDIHAGNLFRPWLRKITEWVYERADAVIMVAEYQKKQALSCLVARDIVVLPLRINTDRFPYRIRTVDSPVQFIHIAYYSPIKDQDTLFRTFAHVSEHIDCHLTVVGQGFEHYGVRALLVQLGLQGRVSFTGTVLQSDLPRYFERAHILLHTSRFETGCAVIQEAMASGVAVCGTEVGILADIGDHYAVIAPPGDDVELAEKVRALIGSPETYQRITTEAYHWITQYDAVWAANSYKLFLEDFLDNR